MWEKNGFLFWKYQFFYEKCRFGFYLKKKNRLDFYFEKYRADFIKNTNQIFY